MLNKNAASFRDPHGFVYHDEKRARILRTISEEGLEDFLSVRNTALIEKLITNNQLLNETQIDDPSLCEQLNAKMLLEHPELDFVSYPYEWCFNALQAAAILHLTIQIEALEHDVILRDASAYNLQFIGTQPIFIDHLSFGPYKAGQLWLAQQQFLEQFLFPLLINAYTGLPFNDLYRANVSGITTQTCHQILPTWRKWRYRTFTHVVLNHYLQGMDAKRLNDMLSKKSIKLPKSTYLKNLHTLRQWIAGLKAKSNNKAAWLNYSSQDSYSEIAITSKQTLISQYIASIKPETVFDLGCNKGHYAALALTAGAKRVIGVESCHASLNQAFTLATKERLSLTPLYMQLANPSPRQGAFEHERLSLSMRGPADCLLALALIHHLVINANLPVSELLDYLISLAPRGLIEFVPLDDPQCQLLTAWHPKKFNNYHLDGIVRHLKNKGNSVTTHLIDDSKRVLIEYQR